jgi:hypothetical protein
MDRLGGELLSKPCTKPLLWGWCPTMDLLMCASESSLQVHRLSWQRLLNVALAERSLAAFSWTPSGKAFSCLDKSGLTMWVTETGVMRQKLALPTVGSHISWRGKALLAEDIQGLQSCVKDHFAEALQVQLDASGEEPMLYSKVRVEIEPLLEVAVVSMGSTVELWALGACCIGRVEGLGGPVRYAWLTPSFSHVVAVTWANETAGVVTVATPTLASHAPQIACLAAHAVNCVMLRMALEHSLLSVQSQWTKAVALLTATVQALQKRLVESQSMCTVSEALVDMLLCGTRIEGTSLWLESDVGERGAVKVWVTLPFSFSSPLTFFISTEACQKHQGGL